MGEVRPIVLSVAGMDPCAGAGILADIKTFEHHKVYGMAVCTANTVQNEAVFLDVNWTDEKIILQQLDLLLTKYPIHFVKFGIIENLRVLLHCIQLLKSYNSNVKIIWDPIIKASAGYNLLSFEKSLLHEVINSVFLITPNLIEFKELFSEVVPENTAMLVKGGHSNSMEINDTLFYEEKEFLISGTKYEGYEKHGTGCILSAVILSNLALGYSLPEACEMAKKYIHTILLSNTLKLGYHF